MEIVILQRWKDYSCALSNMSNCTTEGMFVLVIRMTSLLAFSIYKGVSSSNITISIILSVMMNVEKNEYFQFFSAIESNLLCFYEYFMFTWLFKKKVQTEGFLNMIRRMKKFKLLFILMCYYVRIQSKKSQLNWAHKPTGF